MPPICDTIVGNNKTKILIFLIPKPTAMTATPVTGKKIITRKNNLFICLVINGREYYFYLNETGKDRFVSPKEVEDCEFPNVFAWKHALKKWDNAQEIVLNEEELESAQRVLGQIQKDFFYGFTDEQLETVRNQ